MTTAPWDYDDVRETGREDDYEDFRSEICRELADELASGEVYCTDEDEFYVDDWGDACDVDATGDFYFSEDNGWCMI